MFSIVKQTSCFIVVQYRKIFIRQRSYSDLMDADSEHVEKMYIAGIRKKQSNRMRNKKLAWVPRTKGDVLHGLHPVCLALEAGRRQCHKLFVKRVRTPRDAAVSQILRLASERRVLVVETTTPVLDQLCFHGIHQGVCLDASELTIPDLERLPNPVGDDEEYPLWLLVDGVKDPMNVGSIIRTSYFLGARGVVCKSSVKTLTPIVSKASSGACELWPEVYRTNRASLVLQNCIDAGYTILIAASKGPGEGGVNKKHLPRIDLLAASKISRSSPCLLVVGSEGEGVSSDLYENASYLVSIPGASRSTRIDCLNVSVATGILLSHLC